MTLLSFAKIERLRYKHILIITGITFLFSFLLHYPLPVPKIFSDIIFFWTTRPDVHGYLVPYIDYNLEYPAISGLVLYLSSKWHNIFGYYITMSLITLVFVAISIYIVNKVLLISNQSRNRINYYIILTPVFVVYSIYSFDWIGTGLLLLSIYCCHKKKAHLSGLFLGLSIATRIIPIVCMPFILREFKSWKEKTLFLTTVFLAWLVPHIYFILKNFNGFLYTYTFQSSWHVEDSWLLIFGLDFPGKQYVSLGLLVPLLVLIYFRRKLNIWESCFLALLAFVLTSYKFPPQYMILLLPFFALVRTNYALFIAASILDISIIAFLSPLQSMGWASWYITSPIQWMAILRQMILIPLFIIIFMSNKKGKTIKNNIEEPPS
jgi:hypothetical protein